jgi:hypothetical protein
MRLQILSSRSYYIAVRYITELVREKLNLDIAEDPYTWFGLSQNGRLLAVKSCVLNRLGKSLQPLFLKGFAIAS